MFKIKMGRFKRQETKHSNNKNKFIKYFNKNRLHLKEFYLVLLCVLIQTYLQNLFLQYIQHHLKHSNSKSHDCHVFVT